MKTNEFSINIHLTRSRGSRVPSIDFKVAVFNERPGHTNCVMRGRYFPISDELIVNQHRSRKADECDSDLNDMAQSLVDAVRLHFSKK